MIDVLVPVLGRPQNAAPLVESLRASTTLATLHFLCTPEDDEQIDACRATGESTYVVNWTPEFADYPRKMNFGYRVTWQPWILLAADDVTFEPGWAEAALAAAEAAGADVVGTNDDAHPAVKRGCFSTHPLVRRDYVDELGAAADGPGVLIHEGYDHNFTDRELCCLARFRGAWTFAPDAVVAHRHPTWRSAPDDATYRKPRKSMRRDQALFYERCLLWEYAGLASAEASNARRWARRALRHQRALR